jgi:hypothetical protein
VSHGAIPTRAERTQITTRRIQLDGRHRRAVKLIRNEGCHRLLNLKKNEADETVVTVVKLRKTRKMRRSSPSSNNNRGRWDGRHRNPYNKPDETVVTVVNVYTVVTVVKVYTVVTVVNVYTNYYYTRTPNTFDTWIPSNLSFYSCICSMRHSMRILKMSIRCGSWLLSNVSNWHVMCR